MSLSSSSGFCDGPVLSPSGFLTPRQNSMCAWSGCAGTIADPQHVARGAVPVAGRRIDAGERLLVAEQQRLVAGEEIGRAHLGMDFGIDAAGAHEIERLGQMRGEFLVTFRLRAVVDEDSIH